MTSIPSTYTVKVNNLTDNVTFRTKTIRFGDGYEQRATDGINSKVDKWQVTFTNLDATAKNNLKTIIDNAKGTQTISWVAPGETVAQLWLIRNYQVTYYSDTVWEINCTMELANEP